MTDMTRVTRVNIYTDGGVWCYAAWCGDVHDHNDTLDDAESQAEAESMVRDLFGDVDIRKVDDLQ